MIVISGALVLVALVLLVIGLIDPSLGFVYASIGVSLASFLFLVVGILQRRKEVLPAAETVPASAAPTLTKAAVVDEEVAPISVLKTAAAPAVATDGLSGQVLVVAGRPRYHVEGCRYLAGKETDSVEVGAARDEGFTACGVCKPDAALVASPATPATVATPAPVAVVEEPEVAVEVEQLEDEAAPAPVRAARKAVPARKAAAPAKAVVEPVKAPAKTAAAPAKAAKAAPVALAKPAAAKAAAPAKAAAAKAAPVKAAPVKVAAPVKAAAPAKAAKVPAKAAPVKRSGVIVIPDRGKYHTADCRYVRGAEGTLELTKAAASKQGYEACGVCNP